MSLSWEATGKTFASSAALAAEAVPAIRIVSSLALEKYILDQYQGRLSDVALRSINSSSIDNVLVLSFTVSIGPGYGPQILVKWSSDQLSRVHNNAVLHCVHYSRIF